MGLNCSHGAWYGGYHSFMVWRRAVAHAAGMPPLDLMEGFYSSLNRENRFDLPTLYVGNEEAENRLRRLDDHLPIRWSALKEDPLHELLYHSDCEGDIPAERCNAIADRLEAILPNMPEGSGGGHIHDWREVTQKFIHGLRWAAEQDEPLEFR